MTTRSPSKYGSPLTGSDWIGLPLRIGHVPETGIFEDLSADTDAVLIWSGGPSQVNIEYTNPQASKLAQHRFKRGSGTMDLLPRHTHLKSVSWKGEPSTCTSVNFPEASLAELVSGPAQVLDGQRGAQFGLVDAHVVDLVHRLQAQAQGDEDYGAVYTQSLSLALASYVCARYGPQAGAIEPPRKGVLSRPQRQEVEAFIEQQLDSNFGLVDLATLTGYCPDHFSRLFKQAFEQSPHQYVLSRRVERAKTMLKDSERSIAEVATACGFANQGHLTTAFKRRTGITPAAYRKS